MAKKTIASLEAQIRDLQYNLQTACANAKACSEDAQKARQEKLAAVSEMTVRLSQREKDVAEMKAELFQAHQVIAQQQGYLARVAEDDNMRELGPVKSPEPPQPVLESRRVGVPGFRSEPRAGWGDTAKKPWHDR